MFRRQRADKQPGYDGLLPASESDQPQISTSYIPKFENQIPLQRNPDPTSPKHGIERWGHTKPRFHTHWTEPFLTKTTLALFALIFALTIAGLQIVYSVSQTRDGLVRSDDSKRYLWTYGPTAILVVITAFWRQVDYAAKAMQPWAELAKESGATADRSLLLDYQTPFQIVALWRAIRNRHHVVSSTISTFFLFKVLVIISTGLFDLQSIQLNGLTENMLFNNTFDGSEYNHGGSVDSRPAYLVYGHDVYGVSYAAGTNDLYTSQEFATSSFSNSSLTSTAVVDVFSAGLECETGQLTYTNSTDHDRENTPVMSYYNVSVSTSDCQIHNARLDAPDWYYLQESEPANYGYYGLLQNVTCSNLPDDDPTKERYMFAVAYSIGISQNVNNMLNSSNTICIPSYNIQRASVTLSPGGQLLDVNLLDVPTRQLDGVSGIDIANGVASATSQAFYINVISDYNLEFDSFFQIMAGDSTTFDAHALLDHVYLERLAQSTYKKLAAQVANIYLLSTSHEAGFNTAIEGSISERQDRLVVREIPVRIMQGVAAVMLMLALVIMICSPSGVVPRSTDSIAAIAAILARSPDLAGQLAGTGCLTLEELRTMLSGKRFATRVSNNDDGSTFLIDMASAQASDINTSTIEAPSTADIKWSRPFILRRTAMSINLIAPVAGIVVLEVLLHQSSKNNGLADVEPDALERYSWLYGPTLITVFLGTLFNLLDFQLQMAEPFHALSNKYCEAKACMFRNPLRHISIHATWDALRHSRFALVASSISVILAPLLTIVVSGLFAALPTPLLTPITVDVVNWFNTTGFSTSTTNPIPGLIIEGNMSYPSWTYDEVALPQVVMQPNQNYSLNGTISIYTPAIRGAMTCTVVAEDNIFNTTVEAGYLQSNISTPDGCGNSGWIDSPYIYLTNGFQVPINASGYFGNILVLPGSSDGVNCSSFAMYYGHVTAEQVLDSFSAYLCAPSLERVMANATFDLTDLSISSPPIVDENSSAHFSDWYQDFLYFQVLNISNEKDVFDDTFNAMVYGQGGVPPAELLNQTRLIESFTHVYRQYVAQVVNTAFRSTLSDLPINETASAPRELGGLYKNFNKYRLVQSKLSTHLLEGIFGALLLCAIIIFCFVDARHVLPKPIGSIAALTSLLAGTRLLEQHDKFFPPGSEWWSDKEWEKQGIWDDHDFRMGWWNKFEEPVEIYAEEHESIGVLNVPGMHDPDEHQDQRYFGIDARPKASQLRHRGMQYVA